MSPEHLQNLVLLRHLKLEQLAPLLLTASAPGSPRRDLLALFDSRTLPQAWYYEAYDWALL